MSALLTQGILLLGDAIAVYKYEMVRIYPISPDKNHKKSSDKLTFDITSLHVEPSVLT